MLSDDEFNKWCQQLGFKEETKLLIAQIRSSPPNRRVGGGKKNVCGRYPSRKMGVTIQFESHKNELAAIYEYEYDPEVLEFYDQPYPPIKLLYQTKNDRPISVLHTADFFVIKKQLAGWVECKHEEELIRLCKKQPARYNLGDDRVWNCPPGA